MSLRTFVRKHDLIGWLGDTPRWCPATNWKEKHVFEDDRKSWLGIVHTCYYDYCLCEFFKCKACGLKWHFSDGVDECR